MRLLLTVESGALAGREYVLAGGVLTLGRDEGCGLRFGATETEVSRRHAVIRAEERGFSLTDLGSGPRSPGCSTRSETP